MFRKLKYLLVVSMFMFFGGCANSIDITSFCGDEIIAIEVIPQGDVYNILLPGHLVWIGEESYDRYNDFSGKTVKFINDIDMCSQKIVGISNFAGRLEGNHKKIHNLKMGDGTERNLGLIHLLEDGGHIDNLTIESGIIDGYNGVGSFVGVADGTIKITNVVNKANVSGNTSVGGLIGVSDSELLTLSIYNSSNSGTIRAEGNAVGGIIGFNSSILIITDSSNSGEIITKGSFVGGLVGLTDIVSTIDNGSNRRKVVGVNGVGGLVGVSGLKTTLKIYNSSNSGEIIGTNGIGGLVGDNKLGSTVEIKHSLNSGNIGGIKDIGGVIGKNNGGAVLRIKGSSNTGIVNGDTSIGGIVGVSHSTSALTIDNSSNSGNISADGKYSGGIIGYCDSDAKIRLTNVYSYADSMAGSVGATGGLAGSMHASSKVEINDSYWLHDNSFGIVNGAGTGGDIGTSARAFDIPTFKEYINFKNWDFAKGTGIWLMGTEYPMLRKLPVVNR